jgi:hypothetical protein
MPAKKQKKKINLKKEILFLCSCCAVFTLALLTSFNLNSFAAKRKVLGVTTTPPTSLLLTEKVFWEAKVTAYPTYLDGWLALAKINFQLGNWLDGQRALEIAKRIDPNSLKIVSLEKELF